jgi:hypothetical protein
MAKRRSSLLSRMHGPSQDASFEGEREFQLTCVSSVYRNQRAVAVAQSIFSILRRSEPQKVIFRLPQVPHRVLQILPFLLFQLPLQVGLEDLVLLIQVPVCIPPFQQLFELLRGRHNRRRPSVREGIHACPSPVTAHSTASKPTESQTGNSHMTHHIVRAHPT